MDDAKNPFAHDETKANGSRSTSRPVWIIAAITAAIAIAASAVGTGFACKARALEGLRSDLDDKSANLTNALAAVQRDKDQIAGLQARLADLEKEKDAVRQGAKKLEDEMRTDLESKDVTISKLQGKLTVNILDRVMFDSLWDACRNPTGESVLRKNCRDSRVNTPI